MGATKYSDMLWGHTWQVLHKFADLAGSEYDWTHAGPPYSSHSTANVLDVIEEDYNDGDYMVYGSAIRSRPRGTAGAHKVLYRHSLTGFPFNDKIVVSGKVWLDESLRGRGIGALMHQVRLDAAKAAGAKLMLCTVRADNTVEQAVLNRHSWSPAHTYDGGTVQYERLGERVYLYFKELDASV